MKHAYTWGAIMAVVLASTTGDVLLSRAMKKVGNVGDLWRRSGLVTVVWHILRRPSFMVGIFMMAVAFLLSPAIGGAQITSAPSGFTSAATQAATIVLITVHDPAAGPGATPASALEATGLTAGGSSHAPEAWPLGLIGDRS